MITEIPEGFHKFTCDRCKKEYLTPDTPDWKKRSESLLDGVLEPGDNDPAVICDDCYEQVLEFMETKNNRHKGDLLHAVESGNCSVFESDGVKGFGFNYEQLTRSGFFGEPTEAMIEEAKKKDREFKAVSYVQVFPKDK
jgi:hypothetical protein